MGLKNFLIIDGDNKAVNAIVLDIPDDGQFVKFENPLHQYLIVDSEGKLLNFVTVDVPKGGTFVEHNGPFWPGANWDGTTLVEPSMPTIVV